MESFESDGQQFHQHHQNGQSLLKQLNAKGPRHMALEIQDMAWDRHIHQAITITEIL